MKARDEILGRLKAAQRETEMPSPWQSRRQFTDLVERFEQSLTAVKGECFHVESLAAAHEQTNLLLRHLEAEKVVLNDERPLTNLPRLPHIVYHLVRQEDETLRDFCAAADVGLSSGDAALAETGTIILTSGPGKSRLARRPCSPPTSSTGPANLSGSYLPTSISSAVPVKRGTSNKL